MPIVGAGFAASTETRRPSSDALMTVACSGSGCGASPAGRFDGLFRNSAGTAGVASILVGDSNGAYDILASFGTSVLSALVTADGRAASRGLAPSGAPFPLAAISASIERSHLRMGRIP